MNTYFIKKQENKNQSVANAISQKKNGGKSNFKFVDNRPESIQMRKWQEHTNNSSSDGLNLVNSIQRMKKQPLITNWLGTTHGHTLEDNPPREYVIENIQIKVDNDSFKAILPDVEGPDHGGFGHLDLYEDNNGDMWINHIEVSQQVQRMGIATRLVQKAIQVHGHIYASNSNLDPGGEDDTRHLSTEGASLVTNLIQQGIMKQEWLRQPVV